MKTSYYIPGVRNTMLELSGFGRGGYHVHVWVDPAYQGKGIASRLLREACDEADRCDQRLLLSVEPARVGLDKEALLAWYRRYGFTGEPGAMEREPGAPIRPASSPR